ncbi:small heat shock protein, chloroplastic [Selaginella moellendorffii]|uniref:small heat shock protein, chloroplastic n=1 Tax=Selaginella moellendorffii TaxID=88036 RepID=UPI000D1D0453|nr:small heat shock protein, chloroplastic [Selaginella moellendorffii]|eukprot:XP_024524128.1 small heat shock protein, chloroplastic [Selaginella moellendorffii]
MAIRVLAKSFRPSSSLASPRGAIFQLLRTNSNQSGAAAAATRGATGNPPLDGGSSGVDLTKDDNLGVIDNASMGRRGRIRAPVPQLHQPEGIFDLWSPYAPSRSMRQMVETMNRILDPGFFRGLDNGLYIGRMPWDIVDGKDAFHLRLDMPGFNKEDVKVHVEDEELVIKAERSGSGSAGGGGGDEPGSVFDIQRSVNTRMALPPEAARDKIKAELKNGVLAIVLPKEQVPEEKKRVAVDVA